METVLLVGLLLWGWLWVGGWPEAARAAAGAARDVGGYGPTAQPPARLMLRRWLSGRSDDGERGAYRAIAARIAAEDHPKAAVIVVGQGLQEGLATHHRSPAPVFSLPRGNTHPTAIRLDLAAITRPFERLYVIYGDDAEEVDPQRGVEGYLAVYTFKLSDEKVEGLRLAVYAVGFKTPVVAVSSGAKFTGLDGETITLAEYSQWPPSAGPGAVVHVGLVWSVDRQPARAYLVALELVDGGGNVMAGHAAEPAGGLRPTTAWRPAGQGSVDGLVLDGTGLLLPQTLPPGRYSLRLGLYDAFDPATRLAVGGGDGLNLGEIAIR